MSQLHLASGSPRRREILTALRIAFSFGAVAVEERREGGEAAADMVERLSIAKARAALPREDVVLAADTVVSLDSEVFGKPQSERHALAMLGALSGREHEVATGIAVLNEGGITTAVSRSRVVFRDIDPAEAREYWQSGEPRDKAGAYAIQGLGGLFVRELHGSYSGVVGLPVFETGELLAQAGIDLLRSGVR